MTLGIFIEAGYALGSRRIRAKHELGIAFVLIRIGRGMFINLRDRIRNVNWQSGGRCRPITLHGKRRRV